MKRSSNRGYVCYITTFKSAVKDFGIVERVAATGEEEMNVNFLHGIPAYHIREFFPDVRQSERFGKTLCDVCRLFCKLGCTRNQCNVPPEA